MSDIVTSDLSEFGYRELAEAAKLLTAYAEYDAPSNFYDEGLTLNMNRNSGYVFLSNSEYQVLMLNGDGKLEEWLYTPYAGHEGFLEDLVEEYKAYPEDWDEEDIEYLRDMGAEI